MVVGLGNADFMTTDLDPGKVYYTLITASFGARLWFKPFTVKDPAANPMVYLNTPRFSGWYNVSRWVENLPIASSLARSHMPQVRKTMAEWRPKWQKRSNKAVLNTEDGRTSLYQAPK